MPKKNSKKRRIAPAADDLTARQVALYFSISLKQVRELLDAFPNHYWKNPRVLRIPRSDVIQFTAKRRIFMPRALPK